MPLHKPYPPTPIDYDDWADLVDYYAGKGPTVIVDIDGKGDFDDIQDAVDSLVASGCGEIVVKEGTYTVEKPVRVDGLTGLVIRGVGPATIIKTADKVQEDIAVDATAAQLNVTVDDGSVFAVGQLVCVRDASHYEVNEIDSIAGNVLTMVNVLANTYEVLDTGIVYTCHSTLWVTGSSQFVRVTNLTVDGNRLNQTFGRTGLYPLEHHGDGIKISSTASHVMVDHCWLKSAIAHGLCATGSYIIAEFNDGWDCGYDAFNMEPAADKYVLQGNLAHDQVVTGWNGIQVGYSTNATGSGIVTANHCYNNRQGIAAQGGSNVVISNNLLENNREDGIEIYSLDSFTVTGNVITGAADLSDMTNAGIHIEAASNMGVITGNLIELCAGIGIYNEEGAYCSITGNVIRKVLKHGIKVASNTTANGRDCTITGNVVIGADFADTSTYDGIVVCGDRCAVIGNRLDDCDRYGIHTDPTADKTLIVGNQVTQYVGTCVEEIYDEGTNTVLGRSRDSRQFHSNGTIATNSTVYLSPFGQSATEAEVSIPVPFACTAKNLFAKSSAAPGATETYDYTLMVNGAPSILTCQTANPATTTSDVTHLVALAAGDLISIRAVTSDGSAVTRHSAALELMIEETNIVA